MIGWGMTNDMQYIHTFLPNVHHILDLQIVAREAGLPEGLAKTAKQLFGENVDNETQTSDWGKRPLSYEQMMYAREDTRWVEKLFHELSPHIKVHHFEESRRLFEKNSPRKRMYDPSDWGIGDKAYWHRVIMRLCWEKKEREAERRNINVGRVMPNDCLKEAAKDLYFQWISPPEGESAICALFRGTL